MKELIKTKFTPMLAHAVDEITYDIRTVIQPKLDGVRCYITKDGAFTRNHKRLENVEHIIEELKPFFAYAPEITLDGELYNHDLRDDFNKIISLVKRRVNLSQIDRDEARELIQFHCYDLYDEYHPNLLYWERKLMVNHIVDYKYKLKYTKSVQTLYISDDDDLRGYHKDFKAMGYEGSIVRLNGPYEMKRSKNLIKVKDWHDTEITIIGFIEGKGKFANGLGKFIGLDSDHREVEVPWPSLTILKRKEIWNQRHLHIGKPLTFEYFERTPAGAYRFPRAKCFRTYE